MCHGKIMFQSAIMFYTKGQNQGILILQEIILNKNITEGKIKLVYFAGDKNLFTLSFNRG
jgi:hypothetical protein